MVELIPSDAAATSDATSEHAPSLHSKIESAIRNEMRRIRASEVPEPSALRADVRSICAVAKRSNMRAELLVIAIKKVWQEIPEARSFARPMRLDSLLTEVVTMTLDEFYRSSAALRGRAD